MSDFVFRPSGHIDWVLDRLPPIEWSVLGCFGTEERSLAALERVWARKKPAHTRLLKIADQPSRYSPLSQTRFAERMAQLKSFGGDESMIREHSLLEIHNDIVTIAEEVSTLTSNVILDISCLPKRFFFPLLRLFLLWSDKFQNIIVTYTSAKEYATGKLSENFNDWAHLPLFSGKYTYAGASMLIVSVGFDVLGLQERIEHGDDGLPIKRIRPT